MAAKKRGLGRSLADINARIGEYELSTLIPTTDTPSSAELNQDFVIIPNAPKTRTDPLPDDFQIIDEAEYAPYPVERVIPDNDSRLYGQGPNRSTRVAAHKFVPLGRLMSRAAGGQKAATMGIKYGTVYVKFQNNGAIYRYNNVPDHLYQNFRNSNSKGKFINNFLDNYSPTPAPNDPNASDL